MLGGCATLWRLLINVTVNVPNEPGQTFCGRLQRILRFLGLEESISLALVGYFAKECSH